MRKLRNHIWIGTLACSALLLSLPGCVSWYSGKPAPADLKGAERTAFHFAVTSHGEAAPAGAVSNAEKAVAEILRKSGFTGAVLEQSRLDYQNKGGRAPFLEVACSQSHLFRWRTASAYLVLMSTATLGLIPAFGSRNLDIDIALYHFDPAKDAFTIKRMRTYQVKGYQFAGLLALPVVWMSWIVDDDTAVLQRAVLDFLKEPVL